MEAASPAQQAYSVQPGDAAGDQLAAACAIKKTGTFEPGLAFNLLL
jgi:hypothetical protein